MSPSSKATPPAGAPKPARKNGASANAAGEPSGDVSRKALKISTVSHTLDSAVAEELRHFAFRERISESAVIEFSLRAFFASGDNAELGKRLRDSGAALRRKS